MSRDSLFIFLRKFVCCFLFLVNCTNGQKHNICMQLLNFIFILQSNLGDPFLSACSDSKGCYSSCCKFAKA